MASPLITRRDLPAIIKQASDTYDAGIRGQQAEAQERLRAYLKGQQAEREPELAGQKQAAVNKSNLDTLSDPRLQDQINQGGLAKVGDLTVGADPTAHLLGKQQSGEDSAYKNAVNIYQKGVGSAATTVQALHTLLGALQSNDPASMGQIRTAMVLANGFKRYNDNEGMALGPDDKLADVSGLLGKFGIDTHGNTLSDAARGNVLRFANNKLDDLQDAHNALKSQAQNAYSGSQFANPTKAANLGSSLGAPIDQQLQGMKQKFDQFHSQAIPQAAAQGSNAPSGGLKGLFSRVWNGGGQQTTQAPQQQSGLSSYLKGPTAGQQQSPQEVPPVDEQADFIKKFMAAKQASKQQAPNGQQ